MAELHKEILLKAAKELDVGQSYSYKFNTPQQAHNEYCTFTRAQKKLPKSPALDAIEISKSGCVLRLTMTTPAYAFPSATLEGECVCDETTAECDILSRMAKDLEDGIISQEEYNAFLEDLK